MWDRLFDFDRDGALDGMERTAEYLIFFSDEEKGETQDRLFGLDGEDDLM